jgi:hypothetical protein
VTSALGGQQLRAVAEGVVAALSSWHEGCSRKIRRRNRATASTPGVALSAPSYRESTTMKTENRPVVTVARKPSMRTLRTGLRAGFEIQDFEIQDLRPRVALGFRPRLSARPGFGG